MIAIDLLGFLEDGFPDKPFDVGSLPPPFIAQAGANNNVL